jgi:hypothetical protein
MPRTGALRLTRRGGSRVAELARASPVGWSESDSAPERLYLMRGFVLDSVFPEV